MMKPKLSSATRAFSLVEVVAAIGVLAIGIVVVLGLFVPVTKSSSSVSDAETAAHLAAAVRARLRVMSFEQAVALVQDEAEVARSEVANRARLFGRRDGELAVYDETAGREEWHDSQGARLSDSDQYFAIDLVRDTRLSPKMADASAAFVAFTVRVRWPAHAAGGGNASNGAGEQATQQVLFFTGYVQR